MWPKPQTVFHRFGADRAPRGGDFADCLSSIDIDSTLQRCGVNATQADLFFHIGRQRTDKDAQTYLAKALNTAQPHLMNGVAMRLVPVWIRHHWVLLHWCNTDIKTTSQKESIIHCYDSAPSEAVRKDISRMATTFFHGLLPTRVVFMSAPRQRRGSNECGVFLIGFALMLARGLVITNDSSIVSLHHLRHLLASHASPSSLLDAYSTLRGECLPSPTQHVPSGGAGRSLEAQAAKNNLCFLYVATQMLQHCHPEQPRTINELQALARKLKFAKRSQEDVGDALDRLGVPINILADEHRRDLSTTLFIDERYFILRAEQHQLPAVLNSATFITGASFQGAVTHHGARSGHWHICNEPALCVLGLYRDGDENRVTLRLLNTSPAPQLGHTETPAAQTATVYDNDEGIDPFLNAWWKATEVPPRHGDHRFDSVSGEWRTWNAHTGRFGPYEQTRPQGMHQLSKSVLPGKKQVIDVDALTPNSVLDKQQVIDVDALTPNSALEKQQVIDVDALTPNNSQVSTVNRQAENRTHTANREIGLSTLPLPTSATYKGSNEETLPDLSYTDDSQGMAWTPRHPDAVALTERLAVGDIIAVLWHDPDIGRTVWWYGKIRADNGAKGFKVGYDRGAAEGQKIKHLCRDHAHILCQYPDYDVQMHHLEKLINLPCIGSVAPTRADQNKQLGLRSITIDRVGEANTRNTQHDGPHIPHNTPTRVPPGTRQHNPYERPRQQSTSLKTHDQPHHLDVDAEPPPLRAAVGQRLRVASATAPHVASAQQQSRQVVRGPALVTHAGLRNFIRLMQSSSDAERFLALTVRRRYSDSNTTSSLACVGTIVDNQLHVICTQCSTCGQWSAEDDGSLIVDLPDPECAYSDVRIIHELPAQRQCQCASEGVGDDEPLEGLATADFAAELLPDASLGWATSDVRTGLTATRWFIHVEKPPHVHTITWKRMAESTRSAHLRWLRILKAMPRQFHAVPLGTAIIHIVLTHAKNARWTSWATVASALSSIASALRHLPEYTNVTEGIDLNTDVIFSDALKRALHLARVTKRFKTAASMTRVQYERLLRDVKSPQTHLFFVLCWTFAARAGDLRQVVGADIGFGEIVAGDRQLVTITFRRGKGAAFWGPFTVAATLPIGISKILGRHIAERGRANSLFTPATQQQLSSTIRGEGLDLRSIRRGRLQHLAQEGVPNEELKLLSGHKRTDTLLRYLGWGVLSSDGITAALNRDKREQAPVVQGGDAPAPPKMGPFSGYVGQKGRRISKPIGFMPTKPPKARDLGIEPPLHVTATWPLKAKAIASLEWQRVQSTLSSGTAEGQGKPVTQELGNHLLSDDEWIEVDRKLAECERWCSAAPMEEYYTSRARPLYTASDIPITKCSREDLETLKAANKIVALTEGESILGWAQGFMIPQAKKQERRPVFEPQLNQEQLPNQPRAQYPARRVRRYLKNHPLTADFDFRSFFDQFALSEEARKYHVIRYLITNPDGTQEEQLFCLTRLPMGASHAPGVAQFLTDVLVAPLMKMSQIKVFTMIDNVRIAAADETSMLLAIHTFLARCREAGVIINELEWPPTHGKAPPALVDMKRADWIEFAHSTEKIFLGEQYGNGVIRNAPKNVDKLRSAFEMLRLAQRGEVQLTYRNIVSLISLAIFMLHTLDIHLSECHGLLRAYARLTSRAFQVGWETHLEYVDGRLADTIETSINPVLDNRWAPLPEQPEEPSTCLHDYDVIVTIDASAVAWAAIVTFVSTGHTICVRQGWHGAKHFCASTVAEPTAVVRILEWLQGPGQALVQRETKTTKPRIALVTDHEPIVTGQSRWWSRNGGFSANPHLNEALRLMTRGGVQAWHIAGEENPADGPSRTDAPPGITATTMACWVTRPLAELRHPFLGSEASESPRFMG